MTQHLCQLPHLPESGPVPHRPNWTCGVCGRVFACMILSFGGAVWTEVQGPMREEAAE